MTDPRLLLVSSQNAGFSTPLHVPGGLEFGDLAVVATNFNKVDDTATWTQFDDEEHPDNLRAYYRWIDGTEASDYSVTGTSTFIPFLDEGWAMAIYRNAVSILGFSSGNSSFENPTTIVNAPADLGQAYIVAWGSHTPDLNANRMFNDTLGFWVEDAANWPSFTSNIISHYDPVLPTPQVMPPGSWPNPGGSQNYSVISLKMEDQSATRQYPRDTRGFAAATRIFPPPRTNRIVGGHL